MNWSVYLYCQGWDTERRWFACERRPDKVEKVHLCCSGDYILLKLIWLFILCCVHGC